MSEKQLLTSMLLIHINEFLKYMEFIKTFYPIDKKNKSAILEFDNSERRMKQLRNLLFPSTENEKQAVDEIGACFSDLASKLLEIPQNKRKEYFINITEQLQKIY